MAALRLRKTGRLLAGFALCVALTFALAGCGGGGGGGAIEKPPQPPWQLTVIDSDSGKVTAQGRVEVSADSYRVSLEGREPAEFSRKQISREGRYVSMPVAPDQAAERFRAKEARRALRDLESSTSELKLRSASSSRVYILSREAK